MQVVLCPEPLGMDKILALALLFVGVIIGLFAWLLGANLLWLGNMHVTAVLSLLIAVGTVVFACLLRSFIGLRRAFRREQKEACPDQGPVTALVKRLRFRSDRTIIRELKRQRNRLFGAEETPPLLLIYGVLPCKLESTEDWREPNCYAARRSLKPFFWMLLGIPILIGAIEWFAIPSLVAYQGERALKVLFGVLLMGCVLQLVFGGRTVLRVSPGVVEVFRYGLFRHSPQVDQYPCTPGTTMILRCIEPSVQESGLGLKSGQTPTLTVARGNRLQTVHIVELSDNKTDLEQLLRMITSTRISPLRILSREALVG